MSTVIHVCVSIRGFLRNERFPRGYKKLLKRKDGTYYSPEEARDYFLDALAQGKSVLPTCACDGFSFETGCPGHEENETNA